MSQGQKISSDFIMKQGASAQNQATGQGKNGPGFMNLMQTQPISGGGLAKAKFKQPKPLSNTRGRSVPQERPSNSQDVVGGNQSAQQHSVVHIASSNGASKSNSGIRISSQRGQPQQYISSSNKAIKTLKAYGKDSRQNN